MGSTAGKGVSGAMAAIPPRPIITLATPLPSHQPTALYSHSRATSVWTTSFGGFAGFPWLSASRHPGPPIRGH